MSLIQLADMALGFRDCLRSQKSRDGVSNETSKSAIIVVAAANPAGKRGHLMNRCQSVVHGADDKAEAPQEFFGRKLRCMTPDQLPET